MELFNIICGLIGLILFIIVLITFFKISKNIASIKNYISGRNTLNRVIDEAEIELLKGNKEKAKELLHLADRLIGNKNIGQESIYTDRFEELKKNAEVNN